MVFLREINFKQLFRGSVADSRHSSSHSIHPPTHPSRTFSTHTCSAQYRADHVILTLPLGVLKAGKVRFEPPLPLRKVQAIQKLNYGVLNKVALLFPSCFWGTTDTFGYIPPPDRPRGEFFLFYSNHSVAGAPVLLALGRAPHSSTHQCDLCSNAHS